MPQIATIRDLEVRGKRVLVRVDFNVPFENGVISDVSRIRASLPTILALQKMGASKIILMSHLGRPEGVTPSLSLAPIAKKLSELLNGTEVLFISDPIGPKVEEKIAQAPEHAIILLENLRFYPAEEKPEKDPNFAKLLSKLGDVYINDAFGTSHRAHSSTAIIAQYFPKNRGIGLLMEKEIEALGKHFSDPKRPFSAIIGGAKVSTKIGVLESLIEKVDHLFIGGAMSYTFFLARNIRIGASKVEKEMVETARHIESEALKNGVTLFLPEDIVCVEKLEPNAPSIVVDMKTSSIPNGYQGVDIGQKTIASWKQPIQASKTIFWNGPLGVFEIPPFDAGTNAIAKLIASMKSKAYTIIGGGDSVSAIEKIHLTDSFSHVSTGGGASLEFIELGTLPGLEALQKK